MHATISIRVSFVQCTKDALKLHCLVYEDASKAARCLLRVVITLPIHGKLDWTTHSDHFAITLPSLSLESEKSDTRESDGKVMAK